MRNTELNKSESLHKIVNYLILNAEFSSLIGLLHGKMGVVLFFANYYRYTGNALYEDYWGELLDNVCSEIHHNVPIDFGNGLCGIGWGIDYLLQNGFLEGDSNDILSDIDARIMERDPLRISDFSLKTGLGGILYYVLCRYSNSPDVTTFDREYVDRLQQAVKDNMNAIRAEMPFDFSLQLMENILNQGYKRMMDMQIPEIFYGDLPCETDELQKLSLGIEGGLSGMGLKQIIS